jgi:hypothetical protein
MAEDVGAQNSSGLTLQILTFFGPLLSATTDERLTGQIIEQRPRIF